MLRQTLQADDESVSVHHITNVIIFSILAITLISILIYRCFIVSYIRNHTAVHISESETENNSYNMNRSVTPVITGVIIINGNFQRDSSQIQFPNIQITTSINSFGNNSLEPSANINITNEQSLNEITDSHSDELQQASYYIHSHIESLIRSETRLVSDIESKIRSETSDGEFNDILDSSLIPIATKL